MLYDSASARTSGTSPCAWSSKFVGVHVLRLSSSTMIGASSMTVASE